MRIDIISIFPEIFVPVFQSGMPRLAQEKGLLEVNAHDLRGFADGRHRQVDDEPYGGGPGMVMMAEPFFRALTTVLGQKNPFVLGKGVRTVLLTPQGERLNQSIVSGFAKAEKIVLLCGRYEGVDERAAGLVSDEISIGDYVLSGGEFGAMVIVDAVGRLITGVLGDEKSLEEESFAGGLLEYPQYTRPAIWRGVNTPEVLLSGDHGAIKNWRREQAEEKTKARRPDLVD